MPVKAPIWKDNYKNIHERINFFVQWRDSLKAAIEKEIPTIDPDALKVFVKSIQAVRSAKNTKDDADKILDDLQKQKTRNEQEITLAKKAVDDAKQALDDAMEATEIVAVDTILDKRLQHFLSPDYDDSDLITYLVIEAANPKPLAIWCEKGDKEREELLNGLQDIELLRTFLESGGIKRGEYPRAIEIWNKLKGINKDPVLVRLAMACSLELARPVPLFQDAKKQVWPRQRYIHYEQAYLLGELDPNFSKFNVWEMRKIIDSDATEDELTWGRQSLISYRPDIALSDDPHWQYCMIVKSDVAYKVPDWYKNPKSYDQILSGGGKCGPRAWYGRFICKAFGIPTWGCKQPGHAAMTRWTTYGWDVNLGGGLWKSWWGEQNGLDFLLESQARAACSSSREYEQKVLRLEWMAQFKKEQTSSIHMDNLPCGPSPWCSLGMMQRRRLAKSGPTKQLDCDEGDGNQVNKIRDMKNSKCPLESVTRDENGLIVIPATSCCTPDKGNGNKIKFIKCFMGGQQLFVSQDAVINYDINDISEGTNKYELTMRVCTAHRSEQPVKFTIGKGGGKEYTIKLPYTMALWDETEPVTVELTGPNAKVHIARPKQNFGFSFHSMTLKPI